MSGETVVKNNLVNPDNTPRSGVPVRFIVRANNTWKADRTGRVLGDLTTWTDRHGCWRMKLLPYTAYSAGEYAYVEVYEDGASSGFIQVPPPEEGAERWMRDLLVEDPTRPPPWRPISRLGDLHDVHASSPAEGEALVWRDGAWRAAPVAARLAALLDVDPAVADAPDGAVLRKRDGIWTAETLDLTALDDVDPVSLSVVEPGDELVYLSYDQEWGVLRSPLIDCTVTRPEGSGRYTARITHNASDPYRLLMYRWDSSEPWQTWRKPYDPLLHTYPAETASYELWVAYDDASDPENDDATFYYPLDLPWPE